MNGQLFLGGTTGKRDYRNDCTRRLTERGVPASRIFNPIVEDWTDEDQRREDAVKLAPDTVSLYYLEGDGDSPGFFLSVYSMHEAIRGLYDAPGRTVVVINVDGLSSLATNRLRKIYADLRSRFPSAPIFLTLAEAEDWLVTRLSTG